jgi:hypothetical protein
VLYKWITFEETVMTILAVVFLSSCMLWLADALLLIAARE